MCYLFYFLFFWQFFNISLSDVPYGEVFFCWKPSCRLEGNQRNSLLIRKNWNRNEEVYPHRHSSHSKGCWDTIFLRKFQWSPLNESGELFWYQNGVHSNLCYQPVRNNLDTLIQWETLYEELSCNMKSCPSLCVFHVCYILIFIQQHSC
jgi:hypothetical protein